MIKVNLTPVEELENPNWWIPDLTIILLVFIFSMGGVHIYVSSIESEIAVMEGESLRMANETLILNSEVDRFNSLSQKVVQLESKKNSLLRITDSKLIRFLPIILLENIQSLKPAGVWLTSLAFVDRKTGVGQELAPTNTPADPNSPAKNATQPVAPVAERVVGIKNSDYPFIIEIAGSAVDNVQIAEFMMSLKATQNQTYEKTDLRTQLFFSDVTINFSEISTEQRKQDSNLTNNTKEFVSFKLQLNSRERSGKDGENTGEFNNFIDEFRRNGKANMN